MVRRIAILLAVLPALSCSTGKSRAGAEPESMDQTPGSASRTRLVLLGTGTPNADPDRWGPAAAIVVNGQAYLVDCGAGVVRRAAAAARNGIDALVAERLTHVFITHLHSDHTLGYPDVILTPWVAECLLRLMARPAWSI